MLVGGIGSPEGIQRLAYSIVVVDSLYNVFNVIRGEDNIRV